MPLPGDRTFVGFGFGPIQAGLFVLEAFRSGNFGRLVVAEVMPQVVDSLREEGGRFHLNIAHADRVESVALGPIEALDPAREEHRERLIAAVAAASEIATAVPSIRFYRTDTPGSIHRILARGLSRREGKPAAVYAAENHNRAAEVLEEAVLAETAPGDRDRVRAAACFANTVIGKMSAVIADPEQAGRPELRTIVPQDPRAFLVESFNRILISRLRFPRPVRFRRGIEVFEEKEDLLPFEEAKLYGHNAAHALAAYLGTLRGLVRMEELRRVPGATALIRAALVEEAGAALNRKWGGADPLFTASGFAAHAGDLIPRMLNPHLGDPVERVARDPERKLGWDDRLVGAMRLALAQGIRPRRLAAGAGAALCVWKPEVLSRGADPAGALAPLWGEAAPAAEKESVLELIREALPRIRAWAGGGGTEVLG